MENGFWEGRKPRTVTLKEILRNKRNLPFLISVSPHDKLIRAVSLIQELNISQLPVIDGDDIVGSLNDSSLMQLLHDGIEFDRQDIGLVMESRCRHLMSGLTFLRHPVCCLPGDRHCGKTGRGTGCPHYQSGPGDLLDNRERGGL